MKANYSSISRFSAAEVERAREKAISILRSEQGKLQQKIAENAIAVVLWTMHDRYGFGKKRLRRLYDDFMKEFFAMTDYYELGFENYKKLCTLKLRDETGIDIHEWEKEE